MVKYSYYPGNVARQSSQEVEDTIQPLARSLGIELIEMVGYNGDGGNIIKQGNRDLQLALNARNFALAELNGHDIITPCASAQGIMHESLSTFKNDPIALADANRVACCSQYDWLIELPKVVAVLMKSFIASESLTGLTSPFLMSSAHFFARNSSCLNGSVVSSS